MTTVLESRLARLTEVLLHAERGVRPLSGTALRLRNRTRSSRPRPVSGMSGHTGVAEQVAGIIEMMHPDDLAVLVRRLDERRV